MITTPSQQTRTQTTMPLLALCLGYFMTILDVTIVNIAFYYFSEKRKQAILCFHWNCFKKERSLPPMPSQFARPLRLLASLVLARGFVMGAIAPVGGYLADRWGTRPLSLLAALCVGGGLLLLLPLDTRWSLADLAWRLGLLGLGMGLFSGPNQSAIMGFAPRQVMGTVSGLSGLGRNLGFALGPALATIVWTVSGSGLGGIRAGLLLLLAIAGCGALVVTFVRSAPHCITAPPTVAPVTAQEERDTETLAK